MWSGDKRTCVLAAFVALSVSVVSLLAAVKGGIGLQPKDLAPASPVTIRANSDTPDIERRNAPPAVALPTR